MPTTRFDHVKNLVDDRKLACGRTYMGLIPEGDLDSPATRAKLSAEVRAAKVTKDYYTLKALLSSE